MRDRKEKGAKGGDDEVIETELLSAVNVRAPVELGQCANGIFGDLDHALGVVSVLHDAVRRIQDGSVKKQAHLIRP